MDLANIFSVTPLLVLVSISGVRSATVTLSKSAEKGQLGNNSIALFCDYTLSTGELFLTIDLKRKRAAESGFYSIVAYYEDKLANASYYLNGSDLGGRTVLTNPSPANRRAILHFNSVQCADEADYRCELFYATPRQINSIIYTDTKILVTATPTFVNQLLIYTPTTNLAENQTVTFTCIGNVGREPQGTFSWYKYDEGQSTGMKITNGINIVSLVNVSGSCTYVRTETLTLNLTKDDNQMVIRCTVQQTTMTEAGDGSIQTDRINIFYAPVGISGQEVSIEAMMNVSLTLNCTVNANPPNCSYTWFDGDTQTLLKGPSTSNTYFVDMNSVSDFKMYRCQADNTVGTGQVRFTVKQDTDTGTFACPTLELIETISSMPIIIPFTRINLTGYSWNRCYPGSHALASALCLDDYDTGASWGNVTFAKDCQEASILENSNQSLLLRNLSKTLVDFNNVIQVISDTAILTSAHDSLKNADVIYTAGILENVQQISSLPSNALNDVIKVANNMLELDPGIIRSAQKISSAANRILRAVDDLTEKTDLLGQNSKRIVQPYVAAEIWEQTQPNIIGLELIQGEWKRIENGSLSTLKTVPDSLQKTDAAIYIDPKLVQGSSSRLAMHVYWDNKMFTDYSGRYEAISRIAAARLSRNGKPIVDLLDKTATAIFLPFKEHIDIVCGYWNYTGNENAGGWSTEGCIHSVDTGRHICKCNHLTNFAVLIDLQPDRRISNADKLALEIITKIGLGLSIVGLGLTILSFLIFRNLRKGHGQKTLVCLCFAMLGSAILFLIGIDRTETYGGCITVSVLLHYFILASFMWMLIEGILQYLRFVKVLGTYIPKFMIKTSIPAWGTPLIPVIVLLAVDYNLYYGGRGYCWMQLYPLYWAFILPIGLVLVANFIVFILVIVNLCRRVRGMQVNQSGYKLTVMKFQAGLAVFVLLGLTWVFGFLAVEDARVSFMYVFAFLNAFQGFFVFLLFTAREEQVRQSWARLCCKKKSAKTSTSTSDSRGQKYSIPLSQSTNLSDERSGHA